MTTNSDLYCRAVDIFVAADYPNVTQFATDVLSLHRDNGGIAPCPALFWRLVDVFEELYKENIPLTVPDPPPPELAGSLEEARWRDKVHSLIVFWQNTHTIRLLTLALAAGLEDFLAKCPAATGSWDDATDDPPTSELSVPFSSLYGPEVLKAFIPYINQSNLFPTLTDQLAANYHKLKTFDDYALYRGTPFEPLMSTQIPVTIPDKARFEHMWVVAGSGHGKTQTLQYLISKDLEHIGDRSIIVIDSQGDLIKRISELRTFYDGPLQGRLCLIDPTDVEYPLALNIFDTGQDRLKHYSPLDQEKLRSSIIELYDLVMASLLAAEMTPKQEVVFRFLTSLLMQIPNATIHTLRELLEKTDKYNAYIQKLDPTAQAFFATEFFDKQFDGTRKELLWRLYAVLENRTFERMFSHPRNRFDLFSEMNAGKVILINTAKDLLKEQGSRIFGRFFVALIAQAAQERAATQHRLPCFVYIDEVADYIDHTITRILEQARKYNVGLCIAHQYLGQMPSRVLESLSANTSIKMAGGVSYADARAFGAIMRCEPQIVESQPKGHFVTTIRNHLPAVPVRIPFFVLENEETMAQEQFAHIRSAMRSMYAAEPIEPPSIEEPTPTDNEIAPDPDY